MIWVQVRLWVNDFFWGGEEVGGSVGLILNGIFKLHYLHDLNFFFSLPKFVGSKTVWEKEKIRYFFSMRRLGKTDKMDLAREGNFSYLFFWIHCFMYMYYILLCWKFWKTEMFWIYILGSRGSLNLFLTQYYINAALLTITELFLLPSDFRAWFLFYLH